MNRVRTAAVGSVVGKKRMELERIALTLTSADCFLHCNTTVILKGLTLTLTTTTTPIVMYTVVVIMCVILPGTSACVVVGAEIGRFGIEVYCCAVAQNVLPSLGCNVQLYFRSVLLLFQYCCTLVRTLLPCFSVVSGRFLWLPSNQVCTT